MNKRSNCEARTSLAVFHRRAKEKFRLAEFIHGVADLVSAFGEILIDVNEHAKPLRKANQRVELACESRARKRLYSSYIRFSTRIKFQL